jgi:hypothetical protein
VREKTEPELIVAGDVATTGVVA